MGRAPSAAALGGRERGVHSAARGLVRNTEGSQRNSRTPPNPSRSPFLQWRKEREPFLARSGSAFAEWRLGQQGERHGASQEA